MTDIDKIAEGVLPLDGPYAPQRLSDAARLIGELIRRLNHATMAHNAGQSLVYPANVDSVVGGLGAAVNGIPQLLGQLSWRLGTVAQDSRLGVDSLRHKHEVDAAEAAGLAAAHLYYAQEDFGRAAWSLSQAHSYTARLTWSDPADDKEV